MPYFITNESPDCSGWATIKDDGEVIGCHTTKQDAIDQMVAVSVAEDMEPGGERALNNELEVGDYVYWDNAGQTMYGEITSVSTFGAVKNPLGGDITATQDRPLATIQVYTMNNGVLNETSEFVVKGFAPLTKMDYEGQDELIDEQLDEDLIEDEMDDQERAVNQDAPNFMRAAARRGLEFYADGLAGDGLTDKTVREARLMAEGQVSDDKWIRIAAWIARHLPDLEAPAANPSDDNYPSAGVVAHFLWGSGATKAQARRTQEFAERVVERIRDEERTANDLQNEKWRTIALNLNKDERQEMTTTVERRVNTVEFDVRNGEASSDGMSFTGYAAVFNSPSEPLPFTEVIKEGAFKRSLKSRNEIKLFMNHNTDVVLGSTRAGTLKLTEDSRGLLAQAELPDTSAGRDLSVLMKRGDVSSMSFGFSVPPKGDAWSSDGATRELHQVRLHEVSIVTGFPAYEATTASVRSLDILATRTAVDVDVLSDAITRLEAGETLDANHADLISEVVSKLRADQPTATDLLDIKRKQLDLMLKAF
jgi:HK97 family phage prohead protease